MTQTTLKTFSYTGQAPRTTVDTVEADRFTRIPYDPNTHILFEKIIEVNVLPSQPAIEALHQIWQQEDLLGESLILLTAELYTCGSDRDKEWIDHLLAQSNLPSSGSPVSIKHTVNGYTFINFNFRGQDRHHCPT